MSYELWSCSPKVSDGYRNCILVEYIGPPAKLTAHVVNGAYYLGLSQDMKNLKIISPNNLFHSPYDFFGDKLKDEATVYYVGTINEDCQDQDYNSIFLHLAAGAYTVSNSGQSAIVESIKEALLEKAQELYAKADDDIEGCMKKLNDMQKNKEALANFIGATK